MRDQAGVLSKVKVVEGDISLPGLGLSAAHRDTLVNSLNFIIHCAADIRLEADIQVCVLGRGLHDICGGVRGTLWQQLSLSVPRSPRQISSRHALG